MEGGLVFAHDARTRWPSRARLTEPQVVNFLQAIECPVLLITAENGLAIPWESRTAYVKDVRHLQLPSGGHHLHLDHPDLIAEEVHAFLTKKGPGLQEG